MMEPLDKNKGILAWLFLLLILTGESSHSLRINQIKVPRYVVKGETAELSCSYSLLKEELYSVKWYKGTSQFYQYIPANTKPVVTYPVPGFKVDGIVLQENRSRNSSIVLESLSFEATGTYKCEVIAEGPLFHTVHAMGNLTVIDLPEDIPILSGFEKTYKLGDLVNANCTSHRSIPAATLEWHINGLPMESEATLQRYPIHVESETGMETSVHGLAFTVTRDHFQQGKLVLKCLARIGNVYSKFRENIIEVNLVEMGQAEHSRHNTGVSLSSRGRLSCGFFSNLVLTGLVVFLLLRFYA